MTAGRAAAAVVAAAALAAGAGCGAPRTPAAAAAAAAPPSAAPAAAPQPAPDTARAAAPASEEILAAIQKAMNELDEAAQQCWAVAATERFDIEGEIALQIDIAAAPGQPAAATVIRDTARNARLSACLIGLMAGYRWAPPLYGQSIQLPFRFRAPDGQNTIDRALVGWRGQGAVSVAVLLDENNTGSAAASMFELAIAAGGTTGLRRADRAELWYFLAAGQVGSPAGARRAVAAGDMMYVPRGGAREVAAGAGDLHAMIAVAPGGREGAARGGALPTPELGAGGGSGARPRPPVVLPAAAARTQGSAAIYAGAAEIPDGSFAAAILALPAGAQLAEHRHAGQAELLYVLSGGGTLTVDGVPLPVTPSSVVQIPNNTRHALVVTSEVRAVQILTPADPAPRSKAHP